MRVFAVLLSFVQPGAGHALIGRWRAGLAWALGLPLLAFAWAALMLRVAPLSLGAWVATLGLAIAAYLGMAVDVGRRAIVPLSWKKRGLLMGDMVLVNIAVSVLVTPVVATYVRSRLQAFTIPSGNMIPTLLVGDYVLTDKAVYRARPPQRGDIIVFKYPPDERRDFVKRIVGLPGEQIQVRGREVLVNGAPPDEPYVPASAFAATLPGSGAAFCGYAYGCTPIVVPPDAYFVMGDNRDNSLDSRVWGFVKRGKIVGRVALVYWSWDSDRHWLRAARIGQRL